VNRYEKGVLTHSKGRLLAYLVWFGRIRCEPSVPAEVMRAIGYKSPGHWSHDIEELVNDGYITIKDGFYRPTDKAKNLLEPITSLKKIALYNLAISAVILLVGFISYEFGGPPLPYVLNLFIAVYLAFASMYSVRPFRLLFKKAPPREEF